MGKKKIQNQSAEELLKETAEQETVQKKAVAAAVLQPSKNKRIDRGQVYIQSTYNNTMITIADGRGNTLFWASAGALGFRGPKKATPYAATKIVEALMEKIKKIGLRDVNVFVKGIGSGREAAVRALAANGLNLFTIKDITPIPHNGCRPRKIRRV